MPDPKIKTLIFHNNNFYLFFIFQDLKNDTAALPQTDDEVQNLYFYQRGSSIN